MQAGARTARVITGFMMMCAFATLGCAARTTHMLYHYQFLSLLTMALVASRLKGEAARPERQHVGQRTLYLDRGGAIEPI